MANKDKAEKYVLTDGVEVYDTKEMTKEEFRIATANAEEHTGGNVWWGKAS